MEGIWRLSETRVGIELLGQLKNIIVNLNPCHCHCHLLGFLFSIVRNVVIFRRGLKPRGFFFFLVFFFNLRQELL